jgi:hypothetical protein
VSLTALAREDCRIHTPAIVPHTQSELPIAVADFNLNLACAGVPKGVPHRFGSDPVDLIAKDGMEILRLALNGHTECRPVAIRVGCKFFSERADGSCEIVFLDCRLAYSLHCIPTFGDRLSNITNRAVQLVLRFNRALSQQLGSSLQPQQDSVETLKQSVMKFACYPRSLADTRFQSDLELML